MESGIGQIVTAPDSGEGEIAEAQTLCCSYCGQTLTGRLYFCPSCSKPYKPVDTMLSPVIIPQLSLETIIQERRPTIMKVFWTIAICLFVVFMINLVANYRYYFAEDEHSAGGMKNFVVFLFIGNLVLTGCAVAFFVPERRRLLPQLATTGLFSSGLWIGLAAMIPMLAINMGIEYLSRNFLHDYQNISDYFRQANYSLPAAILMVSIWPAVIEEILFRGIIQRNLLEITSAKKAIIYTSFLFAMIHLSVLGFPYIFVLSLLIGWVHLKTKSLYPPMILHALNNFLVIMAEWYWDKIFLT